MPGRNYSSFGVMREIKRDFARNLRKEQTSAEVAVWKLLRNRRYLEQKFRRQHVIEGFVVDFFCREHNLAIEVDGGIHKTRKDYDEVRQSLIESKGIRFIRITNEEIEREPKMLYSRIKQAISGDIDRIPLSLRERG